MRLLVGFIGFFKMTVDDTRCIGYTETEKTWENIREALLRNRISLKVTAIRLSSKNMSEVLPLVVSDENTSDIDPRNMVNLEVGLPGDTWWYRVERERLAKKCEWFRAMLMGPMAPERTDPPPLVTIKHFEKRAFDHFLRYLNDEPIIFQSVSTARATLDVAHQYLCSDLARFAINYLEENLDSSTVLEIYENLNLYANNLSPSTSQDNDMEESSNRPSAPPASEDEASEIAAACTELLLRCLSVIDADPSTVLLQERFEELNAKEIKEIACRDTLRLPNEAILFAALDRWAASNCRKHGIEPTSSNKRASLSDEVWYSVRYLLMTDREFIDGPMAHGILTSKESAFIFAKILGHPGKEEANISTNNPLSRLTNKPRIGTVTYHNQSCSMLKSEMKLSPNDELHCTNVEKQEYNSSAFSNKMKALVDQLSIAEKEYNRRRGDLASDHMEVNIESREICRLQPIKNDKKRTYETQKFRGRQSIFKRLEEPAPRSIYRSIPDYHRNPHKWTKYNLDDVSNEDMTDRSNTRAALSFLRELKARKMQERKLKNKMDIDETISDANDSNVSFKSKQVQSTSKVEFKKPKPRSIKSENSSTVIVNPEDKPTFRNCKVIMPEYVVGQKQIKKAKKNRIPQNICPSTKIKLDHLQELD
uniref:BACK domain-containing protein n=2 Tax=Vespula pensylvanica TaxID=30213 RepID=A0A834NRI9_VESPE|nr:hypothetical protein H0235_011182 [Vespula pensylvanica]